MTITDLLALDGARAAVSPETRFRVEEAVRTEREKDGLPWYLQAFVTIGAWISSGFLAMLIYLLAATPHREGGSATLVAGLIVIAAATGLRRAARNIFVEQLCLSLSVAGHIVGLLSVGEITSSFDLVVLTAAALAGALYFLYPQPLHRFLSVWSALSLTTARLFSDQLFTPTGANPWWYISALLHLTALLAVFLPPRGWTNLRPLGYAVAASFVGLLLSAPLLHSFGRGFPVDERLACVPLLAAIPLAAGGWRTVRARPAAWTAIGLALLALAIANGLATLVALLYLTLGFRLQERGLAVLGIVLAPAFTALHYYSMETTLWHKSMQLMGSGAVLLVLCAALARLRQPEARTA